MPQRLGSSALPVVLHRRQPCTQSISGFGVANIRGPPASRFRALLAGTLPPGIFATQSRLCFARLVRAFHSILHVSRPVNSEGRVAAIYAPTREEVHTQGVDMVWISTHA